MVSYGCNMLQERLPSVECKTDTCKSILPSLPTPAARPIACTVVLHTQHYHRVDLNITSFTTNVKSCVTIYYNRKFCRKNSLASEFDWFRNI